MSKVYKPSRLHGFPLSDDALFVAGTRHATAVFMLPCVHVAVLQVLGAPVPDGVAPHECLSKGGGAFYQGPHNVADDWLASCHQVLKHLMSQVSHMV